MRSSLPLLVPSLLLVIQPSAPAPQFSTLQNRFEGFNFNQLVSDLREQVRPKVDEVIWDISDKVRPGVKNVVDDIRDQVRPAVEAVVDDLKENLRSWFSTFNTDGFF